MTLTDFQLAEPLVTAMVTLLSANLNTTIDALNATITDGYTVDHVVQVLPYVPIPSTLEGGMPAVGVQDLPADFVNDLQFNMDAVHQYAVVAVIQNSDQQALAWQLRRTMQAIGATIQADRLAGGPLGTASIMKTQGGAWSVNFERTEPGPVLGDIDPVNPAAPPHTYLSYVGLIMSSTRTEV